MKKVLLPPGLVIVVIFVIIHTHIEHCISAMYDFVCLC